jgi:hypothetical protein
VPKRRKIFEVLPVDYAEALAELARSGETGAPCKDCGKHTQPMKGAAPDFAGWDLYMVRDETWVAAGMSKEWDSGFLCTPCLTRRLGRPPSTSEYLARSLGVKGGALLFEASPEYVERSLKGK